MTTTGLRSTISRGQIISTSAGCVTTDVGGHLGMVEITEEHRGVRGRGRTLTKNTAVRTYFKKCSALLSTSASIASNAGYILNCDGSANINCAVANPRVPDPRINKPNKKFEETEKPAQLEFLIWDRMRPTQNYRITTRKFYIFMHASSILLSHRFSLY